MRTPGLAVCLILTISVANVHPVGAQSVSDETANDLLTPFRTAALERWEKDIQKLEARNETESHPDDAILFLGSSSIRRWDRIALDMSPYQPIQRGYGGSKYSDIAVFAERLIHPHTYRALVIFVGNDIAGKSTDNTVEQVEQCLQHIVRIAKDHQPDSPILLIEVTPNEKRWAVWPKVRKLNAAIREFALTTPGTYFIPTSGNYLNPEGAPRSELFGSDQLHLNEEGYRLWSSLIRRRLDQVLRLEAEFRSRPPATELEAEGTVTPSSAKKGETGVNN
ncbi:MAG: GDSL-type esterase/lipase family protein [Planctomycetota bacterium]